MGMFILSNEVCDHVPFFFLEGVAICRTWVHFEFSECCFLSLIASSISAVTNGYFGLNLFTNFDGMWL